MKAIILAAGKGTRLSKYTKNLPKGMLNFAGKSLIGRQIDTFRDFGINDITIIVGYKAEKITFKDVKYYKNLEFEKTNMVESLMCAEKEMKGDCIITYSDLVLDNNLIEKLISSDLDIGVTVDKTFEEYWKERLGSNYLDDMESLVMEEERIVGIGKPNPSPSEIDGRYVGAIKFSKNGIKSLLMTYKNHKYQGSLNAVGNRNFENWHMTDLLQALIDDGQLVSPIITCNGWLEFDTDNDFELYTKWYKNNNLDRFVNL